MLPCGESFSEDDKKFGISWEHKNSHSRDNTFQGESFRVMTTSIGAIRMFAITGPDILIPIWSRLKSEVRVKKLLVKKKMY